MVCKFSVWLLMAVAILAIVVTQVLSQWTPPTPVGPGPQVRATKGRVWPRPVRLVSGRQFFVTRPQVLKIVTEGLSCDVLKKAEERYEIILRKESSVGRKSGKRNRKISRNQFRPWRADSNYAGNITTLYINVLESCDSMPTADMDEWYELVIDKDESDAGAYWARINARTVWGALRALETFVQIMAPQGDGTLVTNVTFVEDYPRFPHRGLMLDTSRHFLRVSDLKLEMDAMEAVKMNVLHWHIVDDQSFPYQSQRYPNMSAYGAYDQSLIYTFQDIKDVIEYARDRGIRVVVEFDTPGHTRSWGEGMPGLLAACHDSLGRPDGTYANINPAREENLEIVRGLFEEATQLFPETLVHLGGDEVPDFCWNSDPSVLDYMERSQMVGDFRRLQSEYLGWLVREINLLNRTPVVWQEAWQNGDFQPNEAIVQVWTGRAMELMAVITFNGFRALLSEGWYLDHLYTGGDWERMYKVDPQGFLASQSQLDLVKGGEACMWAEVVDPTNVHSRVWPRAAAVAERLWSPKNTTDLNDARRRIEELHCRLQRRKVPAQPPNGPGFCLL